MKKVFILFLVIIFVLPCFSQENADVRTEKNVLKVNTLGLIVGTGSIFYEHKLSDMTSGQLGFAYLGFKIADTKLSGLILTPEVRIYPRKNALDGFYVAPYLRYQNYTLKEGANEGSISVIGGGLLLGRQWIKKSGFTMDLFFGGGYGSSKLKVKSGTDVFNLDLIKGFGPRIGFALGFAF